MLALLNSVPLMIVPSDSACVRTIAPLSALPDINQKTIIDGTTQPGYAGAPIIEINGANTVNTDGLRIVLGGGCTIKGLVINRFSGGAGIADLLQRQSSR